MRLLSRGIVESSKQNCVVKNAFDEGRTINMPLKNEIESLENEIKRLQEELEILLECEKEENKGSQPPAVPKAQGEEGTI